MARIIVIANQKGGVGKTTTTVNLAAGLAQRGYRVLVVDMDPQGNATHALGAPANVEPNVYDLLLEEASFDAVRLHNEQLDLLPGGESLASADIELYKLPGGQQRLGAALQPVRDNYDFIIIDTPPTLGTLTVNALAAADEVIIPVAPGVFDLKGVQQLERTIEQVRKFMARPDLRITGVLATRHNRTKVASDVGAALKGRYGDLAFTTVVPENVKMGEAHGRQMPVMAYAPQSAGAVAYENLVEEVLNRG